MSRAICAELLAFTIQHVLTQPFHQKYSSPKWTLVVIVIIFELGSIVCAAAPSSHVLIVGRAITGIGAAGTNVGAQVNTRDLVPL